MAVIFFASRNSLSGNTSLMSHKICYNFGCWYVQAGALGEAPGVSKIGKAENTNYYPKKHRMNSLRKQPIDLELRTLQGLSLLSTTHVVPSANATRHARDDTCDATLDCCLTRPSASLSDRMWIGVQGAS